MAANEIPAQLKPIHKFLVKAKQIDKVAPVVAYYCNLSVLLLDLNWI